MTCLTEGYRDDDFLQIAHRFWPTNFNSIWNCPNDMMVQLESTTKCHEEVFLVTLQNWLICIIRWFYTLYVKKFEICNCMSDLHLPNWQQILVSKFHGDWTDRKSQSCKIILEGESSKNYYLKKSSIASYFNWIRYSQLCIWTQI